MTCSDVVIQLPDCAVRRIGFCGIHKKIVPQERANVGIGERVIGDRPQCHRVHTIDRNPIAGEWSAQILQVGKGYGFGRVEVGVGPCGQRVINSNGLTCVVYQIGKIAGALGSGWDRGQEWAGNLFSCAFIGDSEECFPLPFVKPRNL